MTLFFAKEPIERQENAGASFDMESKKLMLLIKYICAISQVSQENSIQILKYERNRQTWPHLQLHVYHTIIISYQ